MAVLFTFQSSTTKLYTQNYAGADAADASNVYSIFYGAVTALMTFCVNGFVFSPSLATLLLGLLNGGMLILYTTSLCNASTGGPYTFLMMSSLSGGILIPMVYNMLFMNEKLTAMQFGGIALLFISFIAMNLQGLSFKGAKPKKSYFFWCAGIFVSNGVYCQLMNIQQSMTGGLERSEMIIITYLFMAAAVAAVRVIRKPEWIVPAFKMGKKSFLFALLSCAICTGATNVMVYLLTAMSSATILFALNNGAVLLLSGVLAISLFREKPTVSQIVGIVLACVSIVILSI